MGILKKFENNEWVPVLIGATGATGPSGSLNDTLIQNLNANGFNITGATVIGSKTYNEGVYAAGNQTGTFAPDINDGAIQKLTLTGNITFNSISNVVAGSSATFILQQDSNGSRELSSTMLFASGNKTLSTAPNAVDVMSVFYDGSVYYAALTKGYA